MADGDIVNESIKRVLRNAGATTKSTRKTNIEIINLVLADLKIADSNKRNVKSAVVTLLEDYSSMVATRKPAAVCTANGVDGYWLDLNNLNANADTNFNCGLSASRSLVELMVARMAPVPPSPTVAPTPESVSFEESIPVMTELVIPQAPAMPNDSPAKPNDCCEALKSAIYLYEKKILTLEHFLEAIRAIPQSCCA